MPVPYFGDSNRYFASSLKIVTVGLNPPKFEFPSENCFQRFPVAAGLADDSRQRDLSKHLEALDNYFRTDAYGWFGCMEPILTGLDASYCDGQPNTALHTDLLSPIATDPTWGDLTRAERLLLEPRGITIWHSLIEVLEPDIILVSIAERYLKQLRFAGSAWQIVWTLPRENVYTVSGKALVLNATAGSKLVFGRAAQTPFGTVSNTDKVKLGTAIKEWCHAARELYPISQPGDSEQRNTCQFRLSPKVRCSPDSGTALPHTVNSRPS